MEQDEGEGDIKAWREAVRDRVLRSTEAALAILHINTAPNMPRNVHQEESLEQLISVTKFHLENNIYPEFDPVYRAGTKGECYAVCCDEVFNCWVWQRVELCPGRRDGKAAVTVPVRMCRQCTGSWWRW